MFHVEHLKMKINFNLVCVLDFHPRDTLRKWQVASGQRPDQKTRRRATDHCPLHFAFRFLLPRARDIRMSAA
jgi:hypothetical protein